MAADTSKMPNPLTIYMTEVQPQGQYSRPRYRTHYSLGAAKNAIMQQSERIYEQGIIGMNGHDEYKPFTIYHLLDNEWHVVYSSDIAVKYDDLPWK